MRDPCGQIELTNRACGYIRSCAECLNGCNESATSKGYAGTPLPICVCPQKEKEDKEEFAAIKTVKVKKYSIVHKIFNIEVRGNIYEQILFQSDAYEKATMEHKNRQVLRTSYYRRRIQAYAKHLQRHPNDISFRHLQIPDEWRQHQQNAQESGTAPDDNAENGMEIEMEPDAGELNADECENDNSISRNDQSDPEENEYSDAGENVEENDNIMEMQHIYEDDPFRGDYNVDDQACLQPIAKERSISLDKDKSSTSYCSGDDDDDVENGEDSRSDEDDSIVDVTNDFNENTDTEGDESDTSLNLNVHETVDEQIDEEKRMFTLDERKDWSQRMEWRDEITKLHIVASIIATSIRGNHTYESTITMFKNMDSMLLNSNLPRTKNSLWSLLARNDELATTRHMYCRMCKSFIGEGKNPIKNCECEACGPNRTNKELSYFIEIKVEPQLRQILSQPRNANSLRYRFTRERRDVNSVEDIYDSKEYKKKCEPGEFSSNDNNYSFTLNTDGCSVANSSNTSAWPIMLQINEFPPHVRKRHTILAGIWVDNFHPILNGILLPTIKELNHLYENGVTWTNPVDNGVITSKFTTLVCTVDSKARPEILNMTHMNGKYGCTFCYAKGQHMTGGGVKRTFPVSNNIHLRNDAEIRQHMNEAHQEGGKIFGIKGMSVLAMLRGFDLFSGMVVDSMHNVYLGVAKLHTSLLLFGNASDDWYAGTPNNLAVINSRLLKIRPPSKISRMPKNIEDRNHWKASEWRNWILYYALLCLEQKIRPCDLDHLALLSRAAYILNKDCISTEELEEARLLLKQYVQKFQDIFGIENMKFNIHLLNHLTDTVENWGPFWTHSTFPFESWNKKIIDNVTSAKSRPLQITTRYLMFRFVEGLIDDPNVSRRTKNMIRSTLHCGLKTQNNTAHLTPTPSKFRIVGTVDNRPPISCESQALSTAGFRPEVASFYERAIIRNIDYRIREKTIKKTTRFCNKFIYCQTIGFAEILEICSFHHNDEIICGLFVALMPSLGNVFGARHVHKVEFSTNTAFVNIADDKPVPAIIIDTQKDFYAIRLANVWETD